jgi:transcriptional regulator
MNQTMYLPKYFEENNIAVMHELIRDYPLATLITVNNNILEANHIPLLLTENADGYGILQGHIARGNPLWKEYKNDTEVLAIFHGPQSYISPSWYASKPVTGKVVPTWNYVTVHAHGKLRFIDDAKWLRAAVTMLTEKHEAGFEQPWEVSDAPDDYIEKMVKAIIGIEIVITSLQGKWKASQNQSKEDQQSLITGLIHQYNDEMAKLIQEKQ